MARPNDCPKLLVADSAEEAELMIRGAIIFCGERFVRPVPGFRPSRAELYDEGPWAGLYCNPDDAARVMAAQRHGEEP